MRGAGFQLEPVGEDVLVVRGMLTFDTAHAVLLALRQRLAGGKASVLDLTGVERSDSAGLSCVLAVMAEARNAGRPLSVRHLPEGMRTLAQVCEVENLLLA